jgi:hypothetical protein
MVQSLVDLTTAEAKKRNHESLWIHVVIPAEIGKKKEVLG